MALSVALAVNVAVTGCVDTSAGEITTHFMTELLKTKNHHVNLAGLQLGWDSLKILDSILTTNGGRPLLN